MIPEGRNPDWLLQNFLLFFIVKLQVHLERKVALSNLKPCQNMSKKWFVQNNNSLHWLWILQSGCYPGLVEKLSTIHVAIKFAMNKESFNFKELTNRLSLAAFASVKYQCSIYSDVIRVICNKQSIFFQSDRHTVIANKLAFSSLYCWISNCTLKGQNKHIASKAFFQLRSDKPWHKHDSNKYKSKAFFKNLWPEIRSRQIGNAHNQNISGLIDVLITI